MLKADCVIRKTNTTTTRLIPIELQKIAETKIVNLTGVLRGLQLDKDWIEVSINGENIKIYDAKEEIDDVIGRMVNRRIVVEVLDKSEKAVDKRYTLRDIQLEEDLV